VISLSTSSSISSSDAIQPWHAFTKFTARGCGKNTTSESGSGAAAARRRNNSRPSVLALLEVTPRIPAASSLRYRSRRGGSEPDCETQSMMAREVSGALRFHHDDVLSINTTDLQFLSNLRTNDNHWSASSLEVSRNTCCNTV